MLVVVLDGRYTPQGKSVIAVPLKTHDPSRPDTREHDYRCVLPENTHVEFESNMCVIYDEMRYCEATTIEQFHKSGELQELNGLLGENVVFEILRRALSSRFVERDIKDTIQAHLSAAEAAS